MNICSLYDSYKLMLKKLSYDNLYRLKMFLTRISDHVLTPLISLYMQIVWLKSWKKEKKISKIWKLGKVRVDAKKKIGKLWKLTRVPYLITKNLPASLTALLIFTFYDML